MCLYSIWNTSENTVFCKYLETISTVDFVPWLYPWNRDRILSSCHDPVLCGLGFYFPCSHYFSMCMFMVVLVVFCFIVKSLFPWVSMSVLLKALPLFNSLPFESVFGCFFQPPPIQQLWLFLKETMWVTERWSSSLLYDHHKTACESYTFSYFNIDVFRYWHLLIYIYYSVFLHTLSAMLLLKFWYSTHHCIFLYLYISLFYIIFPPIL